MEINIHGSFLSKESAKAAKATKAAVASGFLGWCRGGGGFILTSDGGGTTSTLALHLLENWVCLQQPFLI